MKKKRCTRCKRALPVDEFVSSKNRRDGKHPWCRACTRALQKKWLQKPGVRERVRAYQREWSRSPEVRQKHAVYQKSPAGKRVKWRTKIKAKYGLTETDYLGMLAKQAGACAVCRSRFASSKQTHVDHCHKTGRVRGILCGHCNRALGEAKDDPRILRALADYLEKAGP